MLETVYLADSLYFRTNDAGSPTALLSPRNLRLTTSEVGLFGGSETPQNEDLEFRLFDADLEATVQFDDTQFVEISYTLDGFPASGIYLLFDLGNFPQTNDQFFYAVRVIGATLDPLEPGQTLEAFFAERDGNLVEDPPGYGPENIIAFDSMRDLERLGAIRNSDGISTEDARTVAYFYEAAFDRMPDLEGLNFWIDQRERGLEFERMGEFFIDSDEFVETYGNINAINNRQFVQLLYDNVLEREADQAGEDFWTNILNAGNSVTGRFGPPSMGGCDL